MPNPCISSPPAMSFGVCARDAARPEILAKLGSAVAHTTGRLPMWRSTTRPRWRAMNSGVSQRGGRADGGEDSPHDLTVPESLLQPMREMGVFGLSIPEEYGGSSPAGTRTRR